MNKELIEKLESVGFSKKEQAGNVLSLHIEGLKFLYYIGIDEFCVHRNDHTTTIKSPNFAEILKTVEDSSNVELQNVHLVRAEEVIKRLEQLGFKVIEGVDCGIERRIKDHLIQYSKSTKILNDNTRIQYSRLTHHKFFDGFPKAKKSIKNPTIEEAEHFIGSVFGEDFISKQEFNGLFDIAYSEDKPKQTKTKRISQLENQIEVLTTNLQKVEDMVKDKSLKLDKINKRLNKLERNNSLDAAQKVLETTKEIGNLALELKKLYMQDGGFIDKKEESNGRVLAKAEGNENILPKNVAEALTDKPKFKVGDEVVIIYDKPKFGLGVCDLKKTYRLTHVDLEIEQVTIATYGLVDGESVTYPHIFLFSEIEHAPKKDPKFKVGDEVVITDFSNTRIDIDRLKQAVLNKEAFNVYEIDENGICFIYIDGESRSFNTHELKHAPNKKLELGDWAEIIGKTGDHFFKIGEKVLIGALDAEEGYVCSTADTWYYVKKEDLKPL